MRLTLPFSDSQIQAMLQDAAAFLALGRLHAIREQAGSDDTLVVTAKFTDSLGFVDHPRLTVGQSSEKLLDFRCDCSAFRQTHRFCAHCMALADEAFAIASADSVQAPPEEPPAQEPEASFFSLFRPTPPSPPPVEQISYRFCNSSQDLYPGKINPRIPLPRYYQVFGKNARARMLYAQKTRWGGSCFGFATTAGMFFHPEDPVTAPDFRVDAAFPADLLLTSRSKSLHLTLLTFLECMQIIQYSNDVIQRPRIQRVNDPNCLDDLCQRVLQMQKTKSAPITMSVYRNAKYDGGHAVFPFWLDADPEGQDRLHIYDPNHPMKTRYAYLEKDKDGHYINWRFPMDDHTEYSSTTGGKIAFTDHADYKQAWDQRGGAEPDAMISVPREVAILNPDGELLCRVTADGTESYCDAIHPFLLTDMAEGEEETVLLSLPAGTYLVRNENPNQESMRILFSHNDQSVSLSTNAREAELTADDRTMAVSARIFQAGCSYAIELDALFEDDNHNILLEGVTADGGLRFGCYNGVLLALGILNEELASLYMDDELLDLSCIGQEAEQPALQESVPQKKHLLITNAAQTDTESDANAAE